MTRLRVALTVEIDVDPTEVQSHALGNVARAAPDGDEEISQEMLDKAAEHVASHLVDSVQILAFLGAPWRAIADAVPSAEVVPFSAGVDVEIVE